jgi:23S rRNA (cytosine1962-C5)-methyltransferase
MTQYSRIILKHGKEASVQRFHPWIFSGAILKTEGNPKEGNVVEVFSYRKEYLATGHYLNGSIAVKIFSFERQEITDDFWKSKLRQALELRRIPGLVDNPATNAYRLVFSEGDGLPGLFIDYYNGTAVIQTHTLGMHAIKPVLIEGLKELYGEKLSSVFDKSEETMKGVDHGTENRKSKIENQEPGFLFQNQYLLGSFNSGRIKETGHDFLVDWEHGQKSGFFIDQRSNRMFAQFYAKNKKVLNAFCYSGAFSVYALKGGATMVHSVDSSKQAIQWTNENISLNDIPGEKHISYVAEVKQFLTVTPEKFDMIILDPPAFAKHLNITHNALQAYIHINAMAMKRLTPGGLLFTFSCSQPVSRDMFQSAVLSAGLEAGRQVKIIHHLTQGPDHPVNLYHPEGAYLKGMILSVA